MTPQVYMLLKNIRSFLGLHHAVIFVSIIGLLLPYAAYSLYDVIASPPSVTNTPTSAIDEFDQDTINKIKSLRDSSSGDTSVTLPSPRPNPFVE